MSGGPGWAAVLSLENERGAGPLDRRRPDAGQAVRAAE